MLVFWGKEALFYSKIPDKPLSVGDFLKMFYTFKF